MSELKSNLDHERFARAFELLGEAIAARAFPGCSLAVVHRGELVVAAGAGRFTYEPQSAEVTAETIFDVASLTKIVATTGMAMILYERGLLDLDLPVEWVLRVFRSDDPRREAVTVRTLLAHTSGLPAYVRLFEHAASREEMVAAACHAALETVPAERTNYSDIGFIILGEVLAHIAGEPLGSFCAREIFLRLGMAQTCFNPPAEWRPNIPPTEDDRTFRHRVIQGEVNDENASVMGGMAGHAGVFSNAQDLARFAHSILQRETFVRAETLRVFSEAHAGKTGSLRALGFDLPSTPSQSGRYFSSRSLGHLGFTGTSLWLDAERDLAIILLSNRTWPDRSSQEIKRVRPLVHDAIVEALV